MELKQTSPTAQESRDSMGLGRTGGQRGAEILAGLRAELTPSPAAEAMAKFTGQVVARVLITLMGKRASHSLNYIALRPAAFRKLAGEHLAKVGSPAVLVELAAGFAIWVLQLAEDHPGDKFIEIDLPEVVTEKQQRLANGNDVTVPENLSWRGADLGVEKLDDVLDGEQVDVITMEGLTAYFTPEDNSTILAHARACLKPGGVCIVDIPWEQGMHEAANKGGLNLFSRQAGTYLTIVPGEAEARKIFEDAGYSDIQVYTTAQLAAVLPEVTKPVSQFSLFVVGHNGSAPDGQEPEPKSES